MQIDFTGQVVLVTGATRGIGKQIADDLETLGAQLILTGTREKQIKQLNERAGQKKKYYWVDFLERESLDIFLKALSQYPRIDVCINNAGINRVEFVDEFTDKNWDAITEVNLRAPALITRTVSPLMKKHGYGRIVNISSVWGHISWTKRAIYTTTKFGIRGLTVAASNELARYNILVNAVSPGFTLTEMVIQNYSDEERKTIESRIPLGRMATPDEISRVVIFLSSPLNTYITGQSIVADGGYVTM